MKTNYAKDLLFLNMAMFFISTSGVLGRYVSMSPEITIFWRAGVAAIILAVIGQWQKLELLKNVKQDIGILFLGGFLIMIHWVAYFYALKLSSVAIGMLSLFTYPVITSILEPIILKTKFQKIHIFLGFLTLAGIYFLVPSVDLSDGNFKAVGLGTLSAASYALRNILMKKQIQKHNGMKLMFYQTFVVALILTPFIFFQGIGDISTQWPAILFLALFTTVIGHTFFLMSFKKFSVTTASIMSCTQPIFGIILGIIFLSEYPPWTTFIGGVLILTAVVIESYKLKKVQE